MLPCPEEVTRLMSEHPVLGAYITALHQQLADLQAAVKALSDRMDLDSHNSHKPPCTDSGRGQRSLREKSGRSPGAQRGHKGHGLKFSETPDHMLSHRVCVCTTCGADLRLLPVQDVSRRQVYDLPPLSLEITEHQAEIKACPFCRTTVQAAFPEELTHKTQYGPCVKALVVYLHNYQLVPYQRISELFSDLFDQPISGGLIYSADAQAYKQLADHERAVTVALSTADVVHFDETGLYEMGRRIWLHSASTSSATYYHADTKRGRDAMERAGILPFFKGVAVHDHWAPYKHYDRCEHALCNVHHLRELKRACEQDQKPWAKTLIDLFHEIKDTVYTAREKGQSRLTPAQLARFKARYRALIETAREEYPDPPPKDKGKRGRVKQDRSKNLLDRLDRYQQEVLRFMYDFRVPFDNNLAERDLRMVKVKQKISGTFRSEQGSAFFCRIRGAISTWKKQGSNILDALTQCFQVHPHPIAFDYTTE